MKTEKLKKSDFANFTGTEVWYRHSIVKNTMYTDGIKYIAERAEAYWLIDEIAFNQTHRLVRNEDSLKSPLKPASKVFPISPVSLKMSPGLAPRIIR